jgi:hypothetical protein
MPSPEVTSPLVPSSKNDCAAVPPMEVRSAFTATPVLAGLVPEVTVTVSSVLAPARRLLGFAVPTPEGFVDSGDTVRLMLNVPERLSASETLHGNEYAVAVVLAGTVYEAEKPGEGRLNVELPPIAVRSQVTAKPVDAGLVPAVTVALSVVLLPTTTGDGLADPVAAGLVEPPQVFACDSEFRGAGAATAKSALLLLVLVQPPPARNAAVVADRVATGLPCAQLAPP